MAMDYFFRSQKRNFNLESNKRICRGNCFDLPRNWIYLLQNYLSSYLYLKYIYKTLKRIGEIHVVLELTIFAKSVNF